MHICMYICIFPPGVLLVFVLTAYSKAISLYVLKFVSPHKLSAEVPTMLTHQGGALEPGSEKTGEWK